MKINIIHFELYKILVIVTNLLAQVAKSLALIYIKYKLLILY